MSEIASSHIKPCDMAQCEAHNWRTKEYMQSPRTENLCIREELSRMNESWVSPEIIGKSLGDYHNMLAGLVKEKTGRTMQMKVRKRVNKKTGKVFKVSGSSALRENIVRCKEATIMEDIQRYCRMCHERWGITAIQIHIHRDEGHWIYAEQKNEWVSYYHAHVIWDWMDHSTGRSFKLAPKDMSGFQDFAAEVFGMARATHEKKPDKNHSQHSDCSSIQHHPDAEKAEKEVEDSEHKDTTPTPVSKIRHFVRHLFAKN